VWSPKMILSLALYLKSSPLHGVREMRRAPGCFTADKGEL